MLLHVFFFNRQWGRYSHGARAPEGDLVGRTRSRGFRRRWPSLAKTPTTSSPSLVAMATPWWPSDVRCHVHMQLIHYHDTFSYALHPSSSPHLHNEVGGRGYHGIVLLTCYLLCFCYMVLLVAVRCTLPSIYAINSSSRFCFLSSPPPLSSLHPHPPLRIRKSGEGGILELCYLCSQLCFCHMVSTYQSSLDVQC